MSLKDPLKKKICIHQLVFLNRKDKLLLSLNGRIRQDESAVVIWPKKNMNLYGIDKMICISGSNSSYEYSVIAMDRDQRIEAQDNPERPHILFLSKSESHWNEEVCGIRIK